MKTRTTFILSLGALASLALAGCTTGGTTAPLVATSARPATPSHSSTPAAAPSVGLAACEGSATPSIPLTEGPYYVAGDFERSDITEGQSGMPMTLTIQVVDSSCQPIPQARVDIWHANALGQYSGVSDPREGCAECANQTFLRGTQTTDDNGNVTFQTIFPGWYSGRTVHIHVKVWDGDQQVLTSQFFVTQADADSVYATPGYKGSQDTTNEQDRIAQEAGAGLTALTIANSFVGGTDTAAARLVLG